MPMTRRALLIVLIALAPAGAFAGPAEDASALIDRWAATYTANDADAITALYAPDALLHGTSSPTLNKGSGEIRKYFGALPGSGNKVTIGERHMVALGDGAAMGVGFYEFVSMQNGQPVARPARFTMVVVKRGADWVIAHHHSSALPAPRP
jgi:uncharacterized protein (TIGR02246 family)